MHAAVALGQLGGTARAKDLLRLTTRKRLRSAVRKRQVIRVGPGRFCLPDVDAAVAAAGRLNGVVSHASAAVLWGWGLKLPPQEPCVTVPRKRHVTRERRAGVHLFWRDLPADCHDGQVTSRAWTVVDCARDLPFDEALAIADSALREGLVDKEDLRALLPRLSNRVRGRVSRVVEAADERADNPFESVLRAQALEAGLGVEPQVELRSHGLRCRPDLVDRGRRVVVEAESFAHHGHRKALRKDCRRYTLLALGGWRVVRFSWEDVMFQPDYVRAALGVLAREGHRHRQ